MGEGKHAHRRSDRVFDGLAVLTGTHWHETTSRSEGARTRTLIHPTWAPTSAAMRRGDAMHRTCIDRGCDRIRAFKRPYSAHVVPDTWPDRTGAGARCPRVYSNSLSQSQRADHPNFGSRRWRRPSLRLYLYLFHVSRLPLTRSGWFISERPPSTRVDVRGIKYDRYWNGVRSRSYKYRQPKRARQARPRARRFSREITSI